MLKNEDIICISSIDWDFIWQGHQEVMSVFAKNGNRVLFIENTGVRSPGIRDISRLSKRFRDYFKGVKGIRKESENLYIYSPIVLPFPYSRFARWVNKYILLSVIRRWMKAMRFSDPNLQMPPKEKLPDSVVADFENWVRMGAPDPRSGKAAAMPLVARKWRSEEKGDGLLRILL